jgi:uncharacterized protein (DUF1684 family)
MKRLFATLALALLALAAPVAAPLAADGDFQAENRAWRQWRLERLTSETSWLTLIGLHWLAEGDNVLGSAPGAELPLPADKAPARAGVLRLENGRVTLSPASGVALTADGEPVGGPIALQTDADGSATLLELGPLNFFVVKRGDKLGLRVRDRQAKLRTEFPGLDYFSADPRWRVEARFTPSPDGTTLPVANILGDIDQMPSPGTLTFTLAGDEHSLVALDDTGDGRLFMIVGDRTNSIETYGAGRYLYTDPPEDGRVTIDFNRLYNMPCAFTAFSTCQLPPRRNRMPIRIEAGEKKFVAPGHP